MDISYYNRLEPRPRANDFHGTLAAEIRDPLWFLARQWQMGEFEAEDAGSLAYVEFSGRTTRPLRWRVSEGAADQALSAGAPLERQTLSEPFTPDFATQVELGQDFADYLSAEVGDATTLLTAFGAQARFQITKATEPDADVLNPLDAGTKRFLSVCAGRALNGFELVKLGRGIAAGSDSVPAAVTTDPADIAKIETALAKLVTRVMAVFGDVGTADPATWRPERLEYGLEVIGGDPAGSGTVTLDAHPDSDGEFDWYSFDVVARDSAAAEEAPVPVSGSIIPARVRFPGMAAPRFWAFEENTLAIPDIVASGTDDLIKLLLADYMLIHSNDWFALPFAQPAGTLAQIDWILAHDVFGTVTAVLRADRAETKAGTNRWTMYSNTDLSAGDDALADYFIVPPTAGVTMQAGKVVEDVRFGRDETANMAWGIERLTSSGIGEPRTGPQRDADVNAARKVNPPPTGSGFPLRYEIGSEVPVNWVPLLPKLATPGNPSVALQRGQAEKAINDTDVGPVPSLSKVLNPEALAGAPYLIDEEEIPRSGLRIERVVYRTRWTDGSTHLWVQRRRKVGAGEAQSGLQWDQPRPNEDRAT